MEQQRRVIVEKRICLRKKMSRNQRGFTAFIFACLVIKSKFLDTFI